MNRMKRALLIAAGVFCGTVIAVSQVFSDGRGNLTSESGGPNKHNLSASGISIYRATIETQVCIFCHTPHRALADGPLWNHSMSGASYTVKSASGTQLSEPLNPPDGDSRLCLSCHDGTVPLGAVQNLGGIASTITMRQVGTGPLTGSSVIGTNLSGHHLVSIEINSQLNADKNVQCQNSLINWNVMDPSNIAPEYKRPTGHQYAVPATGRGVQCTSCHDPHLDDPLGSAFLRAPDRGSWGSVRYSDSLCTACHCYCTDTVPCQ